mgnify:CR=1 FL=1
MSQTHNKCEGRGGRRAARRGEAGDQSTQGRTAPIAAPPAAGGTPAARRTREGEGEAPMPGAQQRAARRAAWARRVGPVVSKADATASAGIGALPAPLALPSPPTRRTGRAQRRQPSPAPTADTWGSSTAARARLSFLRAKGRMAGGAGRRGGRGFDRGAARRRMSPPCPTRWIFSRLTLRCATPCVRSLVRSTFERGDTYP